MLALISPSPPSTCDVILSDAAFVPQLNAAGCIEPLDAADDPFDDLLHPDFARFPGHRAGDTPVSMIVRRPSRRRRRRASPASESQSSPASSGRCRPTA